MRRLAALVGELLVTVGVLLLLFGAYQLVWTNVEADRASSSALSDLDKAWSEPLPSPTPRSGVSQKPGAAPVRAPVDDFPAGSVQARISIPRLGTHWVQPVVEGTEAGDLAKGIGHYLGTAGPGQVGNFALAGHRATHGEPWRDLDRMRSGDLVVVETRATVYTYVVTAPWYLVPPEDRSVIAPVPGHPGATPTERLITLTTCNPRWASTERLIVPGTLQSSAPRVPGAQATGA